LSSSSCSLAQCYEHHHPDPHHHFHQLYPAQRFGLSSNIMSLTGIALAIGVIVDNGIIMSENSYRNLAECRPVIHLININYGI